MLKQKGSFVNNKYNKNMESNALTGITTHKRHLLEKIKNIIGVKTNVDNFKQPKTFDIPTKTSKEHTLR